MNLLNKYYNFYIIIILLKLHEIIDKKLLEINNSQ